MNSYTNHIKDKMRSTKRKIMELLNWDETEYAEFQFKQGTQYLQCYIPNDPAGIDMLVASKIFWNWWKNHWLQRDEDFLKDSQIPGYSQPFVEAMYEAMHDPDLLSSSIRPHSLILTESYSNMIGKLIDTNQCPL